MGNTAIISGTASASNEIDVEHARRWMCSQLGSAGYLYEWMLKAVLDDRGRYQFVRDINEADFLHGCYLGLCDHFNDGFDMEDMSDEVCAMLHLPLTGIKSASTLRRERVAARQEADRIAHEQKLQQEAERRRVWLSRNSKC